LNILFFELCFIVCERFNHATQFFRGESEIEKVKPSIDDSPGTFTGAIFGYY
jgi:hypothetical protein